MACGSAIARIKWRRLFYVWYDVSNIYLHVSFFDQLNNLLICWHVQCVLCLSKHWLVLIVRRSILEVATKSRHPLGGKNSGVVLMPLHLWKRVTAAIFVVVDIPKYSEYHLLWHVSLQQGSQELIQGLMPHELTA